jgi:hypothetical protein
VAGSNASYQQGIAELITAFKAVNPNVLLWMNTECPTGNTVDPSLANKIDVVFCEEVIGESYSWESTNPITYLMANMIQTEQQLMSPTGTVILHQCGPAGGGSNSFNSAQSTWASGVGGQWQYVRYGFAAAMMRNWHYALNCGQQGYNQTALMDEQVQGGNYGWLSAGTQRLDPPQSAASTIPGISGTGVWARRFPNGWVLWNPRGNNSGNPVTVTGIPTTLKHIATRGYGDAGINTGLNTSGTITLQNADGLFLIGTG